MLGSRHSGHICPLVFLLIWIVGIQADATTPRKRLQTSPPPVKPTESQLSESNLTKISREQNEIRDALSRILSRVNMMLKKKYNARLTVQYQGVIEKPFSLGAINLYVDGLQVYDKTFDTPSPHQTLKLFDSYLSPGVHAVRIEIFVFGPQDPRDLKPGYFAGCGSKVYLHSNATTEALFSGEHAGEPLDFQDQPEIDGEWEIEITSRFSTRLH